MGNETLEQARALHKIVRMLRRRVMRRHAAVCASPDSRIACLEVTLDQLHAVMAIREHGQVTIKELAEALEVSAPSASTMVERLVELGVLTREHSQVDRREVVVRVSPEAEESIEHTEEQILQSITEVLEKIGPEYAGKWCEVFAKIGEVLADELNTPGRSSHRKREGR